MQPAIGLDTRINESPSILEEVRTYFSVRQYKTITSWIVEQLRIETYQHILEVGYGSGLTLHEVAKKLRAGFLSGVDDSINSFRQASRRNKKYIDDDLLHLHFGSIDELPYPAHYFHSIYLGNIYYSWNEPQYKFMQLHRLLKNGGRLITVVQPSSKAEEKEIWNEAEKIQQQYTEAGFFDVRFAFREMNPVNAISVVGYKE
jgi:ubiquinone/menaquinone biosynthesis C-methylase UbiE